MFSPEGQELEHQLEKNGMIFLLVLSLSIPILQVFFGENVNRYSLKT